MKRIIGLFVLSIAAVFVLVGCGGGGGGGVGTNAYATPPTVLNAGVAKDVYLYGSNNRSLPNFTGEITVTGNIISLTYNGKNEIFVGYQMWAIEK